MKKTQQQKVADFHRKLDIDRKADWKPAEGAVYEIGQKLIELSEVLADKLKQEFSVEVLRAHLMIEELGEHLIAADEVTALDGLTDLLYVLLGTAVAYDWPLENAFNEVHRSNMTKEKQADDPLKERVREKGAEYVPPKLDKVLQQHREAKRGLYFCPMCDVRFDASPTESGYDEPIEGVCAACFQ